MECFGVFGSVQFPISTPSYKGWWLKSLYRPHMSLKDETKPFYCNKTRDVQPQSMKVQNRGVGIGIGIGF